MSKNNYKCEFLTSELWLSKLGLRDALPHNWPLCTRQPESRPNSAQEDVLSVK